MLRALLGVSLVVASPNVSWADDLHKLSLADAVRTAISNDSELYVAREDARASGDNIALARSVFTSKLFGNIYGSYDDQPPGARLFGARDVIVAGELGIAGQISTGMTYTLSGTLMRENRDSTFSTIYEPATTTTIAAQIVQPLQRGAFSAARKPITVASLRRDRSDQELRARIETTVGAVQVAYWNLVRARGERDARQAALTLATDQLDETKRLKKLGTGSELDIVEAEAGVGRRRQELLVTEQDLIAADGRLFAALGVRAGQDGWGATGMIEPTDPAQIETRTVDVDAQLAIARTKRADVLAARGLIAAEMAELDVRDDQRSVSVDLVASAATVGFAGTLAATDATAGVNGTGLIPAYSTDPAYDGGLTRSLRNTLGRDMRVYLGLRFELPLGNHDAEVRYALQGRAVTRARLLERQTLAQIESDVRTTVARVAVNAKLIEASDGAVELSEKFLEGTRKRFRAGASTTFDVLRASEELTRARIEAARARADYRITLTNLAVVTGTLLDDLGITVQSLGNTPH